MKSIRGENGSISVFVIELFVTHSRCDDVDTARLGFAAQVFILR